ncbi:UDP-glucose 4-epimerase GalE [Pseudomonas piscis]|uniref:UDP-glucose 4-epimerase GalE n=1 Tax=Pseudomonas piscis TaxID=2614538 RepID=UPI003850CB51
MTAKNVLVIGGAGYIGSHMVRMLTEEGLGAVVLDDLSSGFADTVPQGVPLIVGDAGNRELLKQIFQEHEIDAVMHFASYIQVGESVLQPAKYYENNLSKTLALLASMAHHQIKNFIFSSTAAIFGSPTNGAICEAHQTVPINPYGRSKLAVEQLLPDYEQAYGIRHVCLRYFNAAGAQPDGSLGERHEPETHLIPLAINAALGNGPSLKIFGNDYSTADGTCVRDYIHVCDIAAAHLSALNHLRNQGDSLKLNLGNGAGYSVKDVLKSVQRITHQAVPHEFVARRMGDPSVLVADSAQARKALNWTPRYPALDDIIAHAYAWHSSL